MRQPKNHARFVSDLVYNEQTKLLAAGLGNIAVAFIVISVVTPPLAAIGLARLEPALIFSGSWFCTGGIIHWIARRILQSLRR